LWIAKGVSETLISCTFSFTDSIITSQIVAPSDFMFVLDGDTILD
jgi:hypothetical protein